MGWIVIHDRNEALAPEVHNSFILFPFILYLFLNILLLSILYYTTLSTFVDKKRVAKFKSENHRK